MDTQKLSTDAWFRCQGRSVRVPPPLEAEQPCFLPHKVPVILCLRIRLRYYTREELNHDEWFSSISCSFSCACASHTSSPFSGLSLKSVGDNFLPLLASRGAHVSLFRSRRVFVLLCLQPVGGSFSSSQLPFHQHRGRFKIRNDLN